MFPLNEINGIIEWIDNLQPLRGIVNRIMRDKIGNNWNPVEEIKQFQVLQNKNPSDVQGLKALYLKCVEKHPPMFAYWFTQNFPDPQSWFMARLAYTRTTAVMSMVGYLLGKLLLLKL